MNPVIVGLLGFIFLSILIFTLELPVGIVLVLVGFVGTCYLVSGAAAFAKLAVVPFELASSYDFSVLPLFLLMAEIIFVSGISKDLFELVAKWLGKIRGGLAMATIGACTIFAAISSSALATAVTIGLVSLPEMKKRKYKDELAVGSICLGGNLGILIPPSSPLILLGIITGTSIGALFIGGIVPGILTAIIYIVTIQIWCLINPNIAPKGDTFSFKEKVTAIGSCGEVLVLIVLVLGGLIIGWFTPTESGAIGAFGAVVISIIRRRLTWQGFKQALMKTMRGTGMVYLLIISAMIFQYFIAVSQLPFWLTGLVQYLNVPPLGIIAGMLVLYFVIGTFMDEMTMLLLTIPVFFPISVSLGFDPVWFCILLIRAMMIGGYTPPYGLILFTVSGLVPDVPITVVYKSVLPFVIGDLLSVILLLFVPSIVLYLPSIL
jgi:tripartite ATP-independent transporter DctM subunit